MGEEDLIKAMLKHSVDGFEDDNMELLKKFAIRIGLKDTDDISRKQLLNHLEEEIMESCR